MSNKTNGVKMKHPFIIGGKVYLRGIERDDLRGNYFQWNNDSIVTHYLERGLRPNYIENLEEEYEEIRKSKNDVVLGIVDKKKNILIGIIELREINWISRKSEYRILIGEKEFWGKDYGREATFLILRYAFDKLNLNKVWLGVNEENIKAVKLYERFGFKREGVLREDVYRNGKYYNVIRMSILRSEFKRSD